MRKISRKGLNKKLTAIIRERVVLRDENICQHCGKYVTGSNCQVSHVIPKSQGNILRWDLNNLKILCYHCHLNWWHKNPTEASEWFKSKFPERYEYLQEHKNDIRILKDFHIQEMIDSLKT